MDRRACDTTPWGRPCLTRCSPWTWRAQTLSLTLLNCCDRTTHHHRSLHGTTVRGGRHQVRTPPGTGTGRQGTHYVYLMFRRFVGHGFQTLASSSSSARVNYIGLFKIIKYSKCTDLEAFWSNITDNILDNICWVQPDSAAPTPVVLHLFVLRFAQIYLKEGVFDWLSLFGGWVELI